MTASRSMDGVWNAIENANTARPGTKRRPPLLMGDIVAARGGVPEFLIQWRRAEGEDDPEPQ